MENIKSFISKNIITLQGEKIGYVLNAIFDKDFKIFCGFIVVDQESEEEFLLKKEDIVSLGQDCIVVENSQVVKPLILLSQYAFIGKEVYSSSGVFLGRIKDVEIEGRQVKKIFSDKCEILSKNIVGAGEGCVVVGNKKKSKKTQIFPKTNDKRIVSITQISNSREEDKNVQKPSKLIGNLNIALNKIMKEDLLGLNNEIIARKGERINRKILDKALSHGKGNLLLFYCE